ncbi:hypothetical protein D6029_21570 [Buttiauxella izardii]|uniref:Uncharacterized protein n=1 Tax=Buttiauxella izardii TaxID=82991 RepID=A0A3A5JRF6_9ENTR|nr:hypothetical protein D6029_21570 [Buttiauxella izardii]
MPHPLLHGVDGCGAEGQLRAISGLSPEQLENQSFASGPLFAGMFIQPSDTYLIDVTMVEVAY